MAARGDVINVDKIREIINANPPPIKTGLWEIVANGATLQFKYNGSTMMTLDTSKVLNLP